MRRATYESSILSLSCSILSHYGAPHRHGTLAPLDPYLDRDWRNVVVMLLDAMGTHVMDRHLPADSFFTSHRVATISSIFPPTTAAATTTIKSGLSPIEHGWMGWTSWFDQAQANVDILINQLDETGQPAAADFDYGTRYLGYTDIFTQIGQATHGQVEAVSVSPFSLRRVQDVVQDCALVRDVCQRPGRHFVYAYWDDPDDHMHHLGVDSPEAHEDIILANREIDRLCADLTDTLVIVIADHGMLDVKWRRLREFPDITSCLRHRPSLEPRAMAFFIKEGMDEQFLAGMAAHYPEYEVLTARQALDSQLFGPGTPHPLAAGFMGDYMAVTDGPVAIEAIPSDKHLKMVATHGGLSAAELDVPLIVLPTPVLR